MPAESLIVGVDLAPIKAIPRVITFQSDITTDKCRATIRQHLKTWKADTVLHDGAPNVGTAWVQDAFSQAELVLQSLKLATEFLMPGGTFVTKVFRSKDYNPLLWVFKQLFTSVEATKPPSSRNVSAEIFVVCRGFKAPKRIDPKFLDSRHVFAELQDPTPNNEAKVFNPEKKKRKREGYEEGDYTQHKEIPVTEYINTTDPIAILGSYNKLSFQQPPSGDLAMATLERLPITTDEIRKCCEDLKVLGKKEFRTLLRWRIKVREEFGLAVKKGNKKAEEPQEIAEIEPMDEELAIQEELQRLREQETSKKKKDRRRENERKQKEIVRLQMHMVTPMDIGMEQTGPIGDGSMFSMKPVAREGALKRISSGKMVYTESDGETESSATADEESDDEEDRLERELDAMYEKYQENREERDSKLRVKKARKGLETEEWEGFSDQNKDSDGSDDEGGAQTQASLSRIGKSSDLSNRAALFFDQEIFHDLDIDDEQEHGDVVRGDGESNDTPKESESSKLPGKTVSDDEDPYETTDDESQMSVDLQLTTKKKTGATTRTNGKSEGFDEEHNDPRTKDGKLGRNTPFRFDRQSANLVVRYRYHHC